MPPSANVVPEAELPILESLVQIRNRLTKLKKDRTEFIRARDVLDSYKALMKEVHRLNEIRNPTPEASTSGSGVEATEGEEKTEPTEVENRVDTILNDVFQLLSLFFLTIGKSRESPATFCQLGTMKRLLTHLVESGIYTETDLRPFQSRLAELRTIITSTPPLNATSSADDAELDAEEVELRKFLLSKWESCARLLQKLNDSLVSVSPQLVPIQQRLITLRRLLAGVAARVRPTSADITNILTELRGIEDKRVDGKFVVDGVEPENGQELCAGLLEDNFEICQDIKARDGAENVARGPLQPIYDRLSELKAQLERLVLTHRWTLRETDLYNYQIVLREIDQMRVNGKFVDAEGNIPEGQLVLLYLLRRCYGLCYRLMASSEPISEELMPIANKLTTVKRCLVEVQKYGGPYNGRDLYPYQLVLSQIDALRTDGRFEGRDGSVPEGQGILNALLSEAHEMISVMQAEE
ncbi:hypothetical protein MNV49_005753 [Pseudohyphozyma bogoriensis]|nr:hypothetical protein MNV49_005753 [Pseudohyphozyma bogoriensis]